MSDLTLAYVLSYAGIFMLGMVAERVIKRFTG